MVSVITTYLIAFKSLNMEIFDPMPETLDATDITRSTNNQYAFRSVFFGGEVGF